MPELPEVETIKRGLQKHLIGHSIERVTVNLARIVTGDTGFLKGGRVIEVKRFGKGLVIELDNGYSFAVHVKMTGQLIYGKKIVADKHTHVIFYLDSDAKLFFKDIRQFGWIHILKTEDVINLPFFKSLGPEPLKDLTEQMFSKILKKSNTPVKSVLLDQRKIAGIGNIYANDALFLAKIHPLKNCISPIA